MALQIPEDTLSVTEIQQKEALSSVRKEAAKLLQDLFKNEEAACRGDGILLEIGGQLFRLKKVDTKGSPLDFSLTSDDKSFFISADGVITKESRTQMGQLTQLIVERSDRREDLLPLIQALQQRKREARLSYKIGVPLNRAREQMREVFEYALGGMIRIFVPPEDVFAEFALPSTAAATSTTTTGEAATTGETASGTARS